MHARGVIICFLFWYVHVSAVSSALEPDEILIIANSNIAESVRLAHYYCSARKVPAEQGLALGLGSRLRAGISRQNYLRKIAAPIRARVLSKQLKGKIRCLLTTYGVPYRVGGRGQLEGMEQRLQELRKVLAEEKAKLKSDDTDYTGRQRVAKHLVEQVRGQIDMIVGKETHASVDSELSLLLFEDYELYRWQPNELKGATGKVNSKTLMVSRLDGPGADIAGNLVDKAIRCEQNGLEGFAYIDSRGIKSDGRRGSYGDYDESLGNLAMFLKLRTSLTVKEESTSVLFQAGECPDTALYCGWYSLRKYIDAFDFVEGAVGYHIASLEATGLRDPNSSSWCPAMLVDGITATLGAVSEPYLHSFPRPRDFFGELINERCLVEAYYHTKPFNSWQLVLIGDPLYTPFTNKP